MAIVVLTVAGSTFGFLSNTQSRTSATQSRQDQLRIALDRLAVDLGEANPLVGYTSTQQYRYQVEMQLGPQGGNQQTVQWVLDPPSETLVRQVLSGPGPNATVMSSDPELSGVENFALGKPVFEYFGQGGEDLIEGGATGGEVAQCAVRVRVDLVVSNPGGAAIEEHTNVELENTNPGAMPCG